MAAVEVEDDKDDGLRLTRASHHYQAAALFAEGYANHFVQLGLILCWQDRLRIGNTESNRSFIP